MITIGACGHAKEAFEIIEMLHYTDTKKNLFSMI